MGLRGSEAANSEAPAPKPRPVQQAAKPGAIQPQGGDSRVKTAAAETPAPAAAPAATGSVMNGAAPIPSSSSSFDSRWGAFR
jgi:hypothetical protein